MRPQRSLRALHAWKRGPIESLECLPQASINYVGSFGRFKACGEGEFVLESRENQDRAAEFACETGCRILSLRMQRFMGRDMRACVVLVSVSYALYAHPIGPMMSFPSQRSFETT